MTCYICQHKQIEKIFLFGIKIPNSKIKYNLYRCEKCGFVRPNLIPKIDYINNTSENININYKTPISKFYQKNFVPYIKYINKHHIKGKHLDIGCGQGELIYLLKSSGINSEGLEINNKLVTALRKKGDIVYNKLLGDKLYENKKYDIITANHVLEHISNLNSFINNISMMVNKGGYLIIAFPYIYGLLPKILQKKWYGLGPGGHINFFSIRSIKLLLEKYKFEIERVNIISLNHTNYDTPKITKFIINTLTSLLSLLKLGDNLFVVARKK